MKLKSLLRLGTAVCLTGGTLLVTWFGQTLTALALTQEQILQKLNPIPVFTVANQEGDVLLASGEDNSKFAVLCISQEEAKKLVEQLKQKNPNQTFQVVPFSLGEMYQYVKDSQSKPDKVGLDLVPIEAQVEAAKKLSGEQSFQGVPLFYATIKLPNQANNGAAGQGEQEVYLPLVANEQPFIPFYFEKESIQTVIDQFKKEQPELSKTLQIRVISLELLISSFEKKEADTQEQAKEKMIIMRSREADQFVEKIRQEQQNQQPKPSNSPSNTPNNTPTPKK